MSNVTTTAATIPAHLDGHPAGPNVADWPVFKDFAHMIEAHARHSRTRRALLPFVDGAASRADEYRATVDAFDPMEPSRLGYGRSIFAYLEAVRASLPDGPRWAMVARLTLDDAVDALRLN